MKAKSSVFILLQNAAHIADVCTLFPCIDIDVVWARHVGAPKPSFVCQQIYSCMPSGNPKTNADMGVSIIQNHGDDCDCWKLRLEFL